MILRGPCATATLGPTRPQLPPSRLAPTRLPQALWASAGGAAGTWRCVAGELPSPCRDAVVTRCFVVSPRRVSPNAGSIPTPSLAALHVAC